MASTSPGLGLSSLPAPDEQARQHSARVHEHICQRIESEDGWVPFAVYMDLALYAPQLGYYAAGSRKFGADGDFVTAPEMTPLFGQAVAYQVAQILEVTSGGIFELGAGSGALAVAMMEELERLGFSPERYTILEPSPELTQRQQQRIRGSLPAMFDRFAWADRLPERFVGVVIGNEVLDALPAHILAWRDEGLMERGVAVHDGKLVWDERPASQAICAVAESIAVTAPYASEISPATVDMVGRLGHCLERGAALFIDYGFPRAEYYHPQRSSGTLMCHYRHHVHDDPFFLPGLQDITSHVDFTAVAQAGTDAGCRLAGYATLAQFLLNCGITELLARTPAEQAAAYLSRAAPVQKLLSPAEMGELFKVIALSRGIDTPLLGFTVGDRGGRL
ncbi:MAG: SAM-dependent methyltransferase [Betaproteobacteria bacterium]|nr:MAG: SAM-dependent methyltransferase [Betaproteobacteria bacterium]